MCNNNCPACYLLNTLRAAKLASPAVVPNAPTRRELEVRALFEDELLVTPPVVNKINTIAFAPHSSLREQPIPSAPAVLLTSDVIVNYEMAVDKEMDWKLTTAFGGVVAVVSALAAAALCCGSSRCGKEPPKLLSRADNREEARHMEGGKKWSNSPSVP